MTSSNFVGCTTGSSAGFKASKRDTAADGEYHAPMKPIRATRFAGCAWTTSGAARKTLATLQMKVRRSITESPRRRMKCHRLPRHRTLALRDQKEAAEGKQRNTIAASRVSGGDLLPIVKLEIACFVGRERRQPRTHKRSLGKFGHRIVARQRLDILGKPQVERRYLWSEQRIVFVRLEDRPAAYEALQSVTPKCAFRKVVADLMRGRVVLRRHLHRQHPAGTEMRQQ